MPKYICKLLIGAIIQDKLKTHATYSAFCHYKLSTGLSSDSKTRQVLTA